MHPKEQTVAQLQQDVADLTHKLSAANQEYQKAASLNKLAATELSRFEELFANAEEVVSAYEAKVAASDADTTSAKKPTVYKLARLEEFSILRCF